MSMRSLADFNGVAPWVVGVLVGTATVTAQGALMVDQVIEVGTLRWPWVGTFTWPRTQVQAQASN